MKLVVLPSRLLLLEQHNMYMYAYRLVFRISHDSRACGMPRLTRLSRVCGKDQSAFQSEVELTEREAAHLAGNSFVMSTMGSFVLYVLAHCELMTEQPVFHVRSDNGVKSRSSFGSLATPSPKKYSLHGLSP